MSSILNSVYDYMVLYGPTVVAIITTVVSMITAIKKCSEVSSDSLTETKELKKNMSAVIDKMNVVIAENAELKTQIKALTGSSRVTKK